MTTTYYLPTTDRGRRYQAMGYWFAAGYERAQRDAVRDTPDYWHVPDHSDGFGRHCAQAADAYENGDTSMLSSIIDMFATYRKEHE